MKKLNIVIFLIFIILSLFVGSFHEPWADEAQSWIIARDASVGEIIWDISRYEGTFPLWFLTLKFFISIGLRYEYIYIVPTIISSLGLFVFLKKVDAPKYVKVLLPFTYYVFFQYTVVSRSYCYLFLAFSWWASIYKDRLNKKLNYILSLIFMSFISLHGMIMSLVFGITFLIEIIKGKQIKKAIFPYCLLGISWIVEVIILMPRSDLYMNVAALYSFKSIIMSIIDTLVTGTNTFYIIYNWIVFIIFVVFALHLIWAKNKDILISLVSLIIFSYAIRLVSHHLGIFFLLIIFGVICNYDDIKVKCKHFDKLFSAVLILYVIYAVWTGINDINKPYSGAKEMAQYIALKGYNEEEIYAFGYENVPIQAYFEEKIFANWDETIYRWKADNKDFYNYTMFPDIDESELKYIPEMILVEWNENNEKLKLIQEMIEDTGMYDVEYQTTGNVFYKNSFSRTECYRLYKLK